MSDFFVMEVVPRPRVRSGPAPDEPIFGNDPIGRRHSIGGAGGRVSTRTSTTSHVGVDGVRHTLYKRSEKTLHRADGTRNTHVRLADRRRGS